ncbi:response regulator [Sulfurirhabdus autotrophica]|uniref:LuxR family two component transcriptional regulator n=1 Tax=Sulfurirhabdus autotrophica TaxID=1706046 RepID=A0A4R3Y8N7_9PROT|nr:response regulator [Sulfurirhabdus autotrophica]TCV86673.1 LuxR family two component transcriptional regulator [Sulfurirhabdus autotrophica]
MTEHLRIVLVDDHTLFRMGLAELLEHRGNIKVVGITGNAAEARTLLAEQQPDVVIMDLNMPPIDGISLLTQLRSEGVNIPILMLTVSDAQEDLANALRAGARGYLLKDIEPDDLVDAIQRAARGETVVSPTMTMKLVSLLQDGSPSNTQEDLLAHLTQREREILMHLAHGESNKTIARALDISHDTVKLHVRHILAKLNLSSRVEAAVFAVEHQLVPSRISHG